MRQDVRLLIDQPRSLTVLVTEKLREAIVEGQFALGENISEDRLAAAFGVSRTPVRDALNALQFTGLVEVRSKRGSFVFNPSVEDVEELCEFRLMLEREACALAMQRDPEGLIAGLESQITQMRSAQDLGAERSYARADTAFHKAFFDFCGNRLVQDAFRLAEARIATLRTVLTAPYKERRDASFEEHLQIVRALRRGDRKSLHAVLAEHIGRTRRVAVEVLGRRLDAGGKA